MHLVIKPLADPRVASEVIEFAWHQKREATFNLTYAPTLGDLMERYPNSAGPFLDDLLGPISRHQQMPNLLRTEEEAVCRILLDMPDGLQMPDRRGSWGQAALQILPHYDSVVQGLLDQDLHGNDQETKYRAERWISALNLNAPSVTSTEPPEVVGRPLADAPPAASDTRSTRPHVAGPPPSQEGTSSRVQQPPPIASPTARPPYDGAKSGTLFCSGGPIPGSAEYVFRNLPPVRVQLDYDTRIWEATLEPDEASSQRLVLSSQRLVLRNKTSSPQKKCAGHWIAIQ